MTDVHRKGLINDGTAKKEESAAGNQPEAAGPLKIKVAGVEREFDINDPELPEWIDNNTSRPAAIPTTRR